MPITTLSKTETKILQEAASQGGVLLVPETMKPVTRDRMLGRFEAEHLIEAGDEDGSEPRLTPAGYRAVGLRPPRTPVAASNSTQPTSKAKLVRDLLSREDGATLDELVTVTGWLPHTTRAALSRLRSAGEALAKAPRPDGRNAYRIEAGAPAVKPSRVRKTALAQATA